MLPARDEQLVTKFRVEIFVPGLGMLTEQNPLADRPISLSARRAFLFPMWSGSRDSHPDRRAHNAKCCCYTTILMKPPVGLAPMNTG